MKRNFRLTEQKDFDRVRSEGQTNKNSYAVLVYNKNGLEESRAAVVASKKLGNAVKRNRIKRVMRASLDRLWKEIDPGWDIIFYARFAGSDAGLSEMSEGLKDLLNKSNLIR